MVLTMLFTVMGYFHQMGQTFHYNFSHLEYTSVRWFKLFTMMGCFRQMVQTFHYDGILPLDWSDFSLG